MGRAESPQVTARESGDGTAWLAADLVVKAATVALLGFALLNPDLPQFQGKAFAGRAIVYPMALSLLPVGWWLFGRRRIPYPILADLLFGLPFLIDVVGNARNLYDTVDHWDDLNHLVNWALHTAAIGLLLRYAAGLRLRGHVSRAVGVRRVPDVRPQLAKRCNSPHN